MAHGDAREGKWRGNWRMQWVASTLTPPPNVVYPALLKLMRTTRLPVVDWTDAPHRFKWNRPFRGKTSSGFCACAITFRTSYTTHNTEEGGCMSCVRYRHIVQEPTSAISQVSRYLVRELKTELSEYKIAVIDSLSQLYIRFCWGAGTKVSKRVQCYRWTCG